MSKQNEVKAYYNDPLQVKESGAKKWFALFAYCFLAFANVLGFVSYSPVWLSAAVYYDTDPNNLYWIGNMYYITFFMFAPPFIPLLEKRLDICLQVSAVLSAVGSWIIWFGKQSFLWCLIGYFVVGVSEALFLAVPVFWFTAYDRTLATCLGSYATLAGIMASYTYSSFQFWDLLDQDIINIQLEKMNFIIAILNTITVPLCFLFIRNKSQKVRAGEVSFTQLIRRKVLGFQNSFLIFSELKSFSRFNGICYVYWYIVGLYFCYITSTLSFQLHLITGIFFTGSGIIAGIWISFKLDRQARQGKQPDYDRFIKLTTLVGFLGLMVQSFILQFLPFWLLLILNIFSGIGLNVIYPLAIEAFVEKLYPLKSLIVNTWGVANMLGFALNYILVLPTILEYGIWLSLVILTPFQLRFELAN